MTAKQYRLAASAAIAGGVAWAVSGPLQLAGLNEHETKVQTVGEHLIISLFSLALVLTAAGLLALARHAASDAGARIAAGGMVVLAGLALSSNINGEDLAIFPFVAVATNLMWLGGSIHLARSLHRTGRVSKQLAVALPLVQVAALPLAAVGGGVLAGAYWLVVGYLMHAGAVERRLARPAAAHS
jgi:hypothetical protein